MHEKANGGMRFAFPPCGLACPWTAGGGGPTQTGQTEADTQVSPYKRLRESLYSRRLQPAQAKACGYNLKPMP
jgi:hypothetical protein